MSNSLSFFFLVVGNSSHCYLTGFYKIYLARGNISCHLQPRWPEENACAHHFLPFLQLLLSNGENKWCKTLKLFSFHRNPKLIGFKVIISEESICCRGEHPRCLLCHSSVHKLAFIYNVKLALIRGYFYKLPLRCVFDLSVSRWNHLPGSYFVLHLILIKSIRRISGSLFLRRWPLGGLQR